VDGFTIRAIVCDDRDSGPPWENEDGHGPVSDWTSREKRPGERTLIQDHGSRRFYDFAEAVKIARRDGWGVPIPGGLTKGEIAAAAVESDFKALKAWCNDEWHYVGVRLAVFRAGVPLASHAASLWGIEANYPGSDNAYLQEVANELLPEALDVARKQLAKLCDCKESVP
jgi:hypothetical protein